MEKIIRFNWHGLWLLEFTLIVIRILDKILQHNPDALFIAKRYAVASAFRAQLAQITVIERSNILSSNISAADIERDTLYNGIFFVARGWKKMPLADESRYGNLLYAAFTKHGSDIPDASYTLATQRYNLFIADVEAQPALVEALAKMGMTNAFAALKAANAKVEQLYVQRGDTEAAKPNIDTRTIRSECTKAMTALFDGIEFAATEHDDVDYSALFAELNEINASIRTQLKARATRHKSGQKVEAEPPIEVK